MNAVPYQDLLGIPFDGYGQHDCVWIARVVNERAGKGIPRGALPGGYENQDHALSQEPEGGWERIGDEPCHASRVGDVIYTVANGRHHLTTLVQVAAPALAITTSERHGVQAFSPARMDASTVVGVYRLRE